MLSDLNSNVPVTIAPQNVQAIITGRGDNIGHIKYMKDGFSNDLNNQSIVYTSGTGAIFKSGIPIGKLKIKEEGSTKKFNVEFYSDFSQLKYVFAEVIIKTAIENTTQNTTNNEISKPVDVKLNILEDELKIVEDTKLKFKQENEELKKKINNLNNDILDLKNNIFLQKEKIEQSDLDKKEIEFLKMNLYYGHKCRRSFFNTKGFTVGSDDYRNCVFNKGRKN